MLKLIAIVLLTIKESYRKKIFYVLLIFALALVSSSVFFPVIDITQRVKLVEVWSIRALSLFTALAAVFIAGVSIPSDIEEKRLYNLISKPLPKMIFFLGKYIGFTCVLGIFLIVTGIVTLVYTRVVHMGIGREDMVLQARPKIITADVLPRNGAVTFKVSDKVKYGLKGVNNGDILWHFKGVDTNSFDDNIIAEFKLGVDDERSGTPASNYAVIYTGEIDVMIVNPENSKASQSRHYIKANTPLSVQFPRSLISSKGELMVLLKRSESSTIIIAGSDSVILYGRNQSFELNYAKGILLIFLQSLIVLTASIMASSFLSAPISILFGVFVFFCGSIYGFVEDSTKIADKAIENVRMHPERKPTKDDIPVEVLEVSNFISKNVLQVIPNFTKFDFSQYLLNNLAIPNRVILSSSLYAGMFVAVLLILGLLVIRAKDFS